MIRTFALAVAIAALSVAGPSWAGVGGPDQQQAASTSSTAGSGGPVMPLATQGTQPGVTGDEQFVTGKVIMTTPSEIVLHTDQGMQRFVVDSQMQNNGYVPVEGDTVTLGYVTGAGTSRVTKITHTAEATTTAPSASDQTQTASTAGGSEPTSTAGDSQQTPQESKPDVSPAPAAPAATASESDVRSPDAGKHAARLPKTASNRPLILLIGVFALAAAAVVRFAARA